VKHRRDWQNKHVRGRRARPERDRSSRRDAIMAGLAGVGETSGRLCGLLSTRSDQTLENYRLQKKVRIKSPRSERDQWSTGQLPVSSMWIFGVRDRTENAVRSGLVSASAVIPPDWRLSTDGADGSQAFGLNNAMVFTISSFL
jgi:hypothetical protein